MVIALLAATAGAADYRCQLLGPVEGTVGQAMTAEARASAGAIYGAVEVLNREVLPRLPEGDGVAAFAGDTTIGNVAKLPVLIADACPREGDVGLYQYDVNAVNYAVAYRAGPLTLMYSTSALMSYAPAGNFWRATMPVLNLAGGTYWALAAPFFGGEADLYATNDYVAEYGLNYDFVLGATADLVVAEVGGGYVGSRGFYVTGLQPKVRLFARAVASDGVSRLPQAMGGVDRVPIEGMLSSLYARRVESGPADQEVPLLQRASRGTLHASQEAIAGILDVGAAALVSPVPGLHELRVRLHPRTDLDDLAEQGLTPDQLPSVEVGTIQAPPVPEFGIEGRIRPHVALRYGALVEERWLLSAELSLNSDEVLAAFPYAHDSVLFRVAVVPSLGSE